ncbi:putative zinc-binding metallopeptidase [Nocardioides sp. GY 10127]|uniref:zinc-binding metallopeptidase family protein n=1 Tax=Nocardioides sp. GY 10127 TaxID=2569762 RepID=UPI0010A86829|nr:putative zinc-binding metallopeptidase [Nocardioides sp. GY 10127]TIC82900.1 hypothetical protein E8D37_09610 [Nocardioides sp. GY 10127]
MKAYRCRVCANPLYFENSVCVSCGTNLGWSRAERDIVPVDAKGTYTDAAGEVWYVCKNLNLSGCTWLTRDEGGWCFSCHLTRTRPNDADLEGISNYPVAEQAKRALITELEGLGLPILSKQGEDGAGTGADEVEGLAFDLLSSVAENVVIGHADGVITIDLAESDTVYREKVRDQMGEPYRTMLGHFRHEIGHYYQWQLVRDDETHARYVELFGDDTVSYQDAIDRHYAEGAPADWADHFISTYATMHPFEDFAETWAHYLHIVDTIETARSYGLAGPMAVEPAFRDVVQHTWIPLSTALNMVNRSMGKEDLYPFVIPEAVVDKLEFVDGLVRARSGNVTGTRPLG